MTGNRPILLLAIALALAAGAAGSGLVAHIRYSAELAKRDAQIRDLDDLIRQRNDVIRQQAQRITTMSAQLAAASPSTATDAIARLKNELATAEADANAAPANPDALYQNGRIVAVVRGAYPDAANRSVTFSAITARSELALPGTFKFMQWNLRCDDSGLKATTTLGQTREVNYYRIQCRML